MIFEPGRTIVRRNLYPDGRIGSVLCGRVVSDDERGLAMWVDAGSQKLGRVDGAGRPTRPLSLLTSLRMTTTLRLTTWEPIRTLMVMPPGAAHSVWWSWLPGQGFDGWYVNLERPVTRWAGGVDVYDQELDLLVRPDGRWSWKDEDAFAEYTGHPAFWDEAEAADVRAEGERLLALARTRAAPFDGRWLDFHPDPTWQPTRMPHWWELPADSTCWGPEYFRA
ncbi:hypothetical protein SAMN05421812_108294 [Asanoa hainanensis]|uniref:DUF402 domain-containing protein n=1 Tax=Asanoa hainanensis TaxID=560556 RepID=A0A239NFH3_9ACTN|nr:DUF402 domain-containing protein [Asanoa hainanensis]SNT53717.1 hypothetical protein SAMN05421812_108294 [Asanoa hainanensis]